MRIVVAILVNVALLVVLLPWLRRQWQWAGAGGWRVVLVAGLGLRVGVGLARNWTLKLDAEFLTHSSYIVTQQLWTGPATAWRTLTGAVTFFWVGTPGGGAAAVFQNTSNTWFLIKLLAVLNFGSLGAGWLNSLYISTFAFVGCWCLARKLREALSDTPAEAGAVAFVLWPSVWFWATGISKEAVLLSSGAWLTARMVGYLYGATAGEATRGRVGWWVGTAALATLHFQMRYFFATPLLGVLGGVALGHWLGRYQRTRSRWAQAAALGSVLGIGVWLVPQLSVAFRANKFTNQVIRVYTFEVAHSLGRPHFEYPHLRPTLASMAAHAPLAVANALTRPWLGESGQPLYVAAGLENAALLLLLALAAWAGVRGRAGRLPFGLGLGLGIFCLTLAFLIGLTSPNLGSLNRYRSDLLPFLLLLLLQNDYAAAGLRWLGLSGSRSGRPEIPCRPAA